MSSKHLDLTGKKFNRLTAIEFVESRKGCGNIWRFRCDCGNEIEVLGSRVKNGYTKSCGCLQRERARESAEDLTGKKFNKLTALYRVGNIGKCAAWHCVCECGNEVDVRAESLKSGNTKACGCMIPTTYQNSYIHGMSKTRLYKIWQGMYTRCYRENNKYYCNYGGRGITVCDEWRNNFIDFRDWALKNGYSDELTIDRIDVNGNYEPENCRWATRIEQMNNTRANKKVDYKGERRTISEFARMHNMEPSVVRSRIARGWKMEDALSFPKMKRGGSR